MDLVIDANVLFAALIRQSVTSDLLFRDDFHLYAPEFLLEEFEKYHNTIIAKTERTDADIAVLVSVLQRRIAFIPREEIKPFLHRAQEFSPDEKDVPYLALALKLHCALWSQDRALKEKQTIIRVYTTKELVDI